MKSKLLANITPGEILAKDFLKPMGLTQYRLAKDVGLLKMRAMLAALPGRFIALASATEQISLRVEMRSRRLINPPCLGSRNF